jgi:hypothetical protein
LVSKRQKTTSRCSRCGRLRLLHIHQIRKAEGIQNYLPPHGCSLSLYETTNSACLKCSLPPHDPCQTPSVSVLFFKLLDEHAYSELLYSSCHSLFIVPLIVAKGGIESTGDEYCGAKQQLAGIVVGGRIRAHAAGRRARVPAIKKGSP